MKMVRACDSIIFEIPILTVATHIARPYYSQNRDLKYNRITSSHYLHLNCLGTFTICMHLPYRTKLWRGENFGEFGESPQFAKFFSPTFPMKHENAGKPWIRQSFFRQCFKITISPNFLPPKFCSIQ